MKAQMKGVVNHSKGHSTRDSNQGMESTYLLSDITLMDTDRQAAQTLQK